MSRTAMAARPPTTDGALPRPSEKRIMRGSTEGLRLFKARSSDGEPTRRRVAERSPPPATPSPPKSSSRGRRSERRASAGGSEPGKTGPPREPRHVRKLLAAAELRPVATATWVPAVAPPTPGTSAAAAPAGPAPWMRAAAARTEPENPAKNCDIVVRKKWREEGRNRLKAGARLGAKRLRSSVGWEGVEADGRAGAVVEEGNDSDDKTNEQI